MSTASAPPGPESAWTVACLCAAWCRTCDAYQQTLAAVRDALAQAHPDQALRFLWVDIEDEDELVGDLDIQDFPTVLIAQGEAVLFFGPILPHAQTLSRLVESALSAELAAPHGGWDPDVLALPARLAGRRGL